MLGVLGFWLFVLFLFFGSGAWAIIGGIKVAQSLKGLKGNKVGQ